MVIAEPALFVVERGEEQVGPVDLVEGPGSVVTTGQRVGQWRAYPVEDAGAEQEIADVIWLGGQDFFAEVVDDVPVCSGEPLDELRAGGAVGAVGEAQRGQLQTCGPPLGPGDEPLHLTH